MTDKEGRPIDLYGNGYMMMRNICIGKPVLAGYLTPTVAVSTRMVEWEEVFSWILLAGSPFRRCLQHKICAAYFGAYF